MAIFEIEMLSVGNADSSIIRWYSSQNHEYVVLIDAGNKSDGKKIIEQIKTHTNQKYIDLAICTHPDVCNFIFFLCFHTSIITAAIMFAMDII